uniref:RNase H type-1 domain-containing protein n=1 Tax=Chenopodium quinoa TaxID=63459 RepID=A0A803LM12_CHEQI
MEKIQKLEVESKATLEMLQAESQASLEKLSKELESVKSSKKKRVRISDIPQFTLVSSDESEGEDEREEPRDKKDQSGENLTPMAKEVVVFKAQNWKMMKLLTRLPGLGLVLKSPQGDMIVPAICCDFKATNNEEEYEVLIAGMNLAKDLGVTNLQVFCDSVLITSQMNGEFAAKDSKMVLYLDFAKSLATKFSTFTIKQIPRNKNTQADALANLGSALRKSKFSSIPLIHSLAPAINTSNQPPKPNFIAPVANPTSWIQPIFDYLEHDTLPENKAKARALRFKASRYTIIQGVLFKKSTRDILQRCIKEDGYEQKSSKTSMMENVEPIQLEEP